MRSNALAESNAKIDLNNHFQKIENFEKEHFSFQTLAKLCYKQHSKRHTAGDVNDIPNTK